MAQEISREELTAKIRRRDDFHLVCITGNDKEEVIEGSLRIPLERLKDEAPGRFFPRDDVVLYSSDSNRTKEAVKVLEGMGFLKVRFLSRNQV